jgi:alpha-L-arabinofuranosidase
MMGDVSFTWSGFDTFTNIVALSCIFFMLVVFQDVVAGIEFARGGPKTTWGSIRAAMGHPQPFKLDYVSIGNQECWMLYYRGL